MKSYPTVQSLAPPVLHGGVKDCIESFVRPAPLGKEHGVYEIGYEAAKRDLLWQLRGILGDDALEVVL